MAIKLIDEIRDNYPEYKNTTKEQAMEIIYEKEYKDQPKEKVYEYLNQPVTRGDLKVAGVGFAESIETAIPGLNTAFLHIGEIINSSPTSRMIWEYASGSPSLFKTAVTGKYEPGVDKETMQKYKELSIDYTPVNQLTDTERKMWSGKIGGVFGSAVKFVAYSPMGLTPMALDIYGNTYLEISKSHPEWSEKQKRGYSIARAIPEALLERWGTKQLVDPFLKIGKSTLKQSLKKGVLFKGVEAGLKGYMTEGSQEASQQLAGNVVDKIAGIDRGLFDGMVESFVLGGLVGSTMGFGSGTISQGVSKQKYRTTLTDIYGLTDSEVKEFEDILSKVVDDTIENNPEGLEQAIKMVNDSKILQELPDVTMELQNKLKGMGMPLEDTIEFLSNTTEADQQEVLDDIVSRETQEQVQRYEEEKKRVYQEQINIGRSEKEAQGVVNAIDRFIETRATKEQIPREEAIRRLGIKFKEAQTAPKTVKERERVLYQSKMAGYKKKGELVISPRFNDDSLYSKLGNMYGNELRLTALEQREMKEQGNKPRTVKKKQRLERDMDSLTDEIIEEISYPIKDWLDSHGAESPASWADMVLDENGMLGEPMLRDDGTFYMGGIGGQQQIDIGDTVIDRYNKELSGDKDVEVESLRELLNLTDEESAKLDDYEVEEMYREQNPDEFPYFDFFEELSDYYGGVESLLLIPEIKSIIRDALETEGYQQWYDNGGISADIIDDISTAYNNLQEATTIKEKVMAIDKAVNLEHHTGKMYDLMNLSKTEMNELSDIGEYSGIKSFDIDPDFIAFQGESARRGMFTRENGQSIITVFQDKADRSTILHELGHAFLTYYEEFSPQEMDRVKKWAGVEDIASLTDEQYRDFQEKFARGFEAYVREGKASDPSIRQVFADFMEWLKDIYKSVKELDITLSPEIVSFYDDMFAGKELLSKRQQSEKTRTLALFQNMWDKIDELRLKGKKLKKEYRKKAYQAEIDTILKEIDDIYMMIWNEPAKGRFAEIKRRAMEDWESNPLSAFFESKIRISPEYEALMKRYGVPAVAKTTKETAPTFDKLMENATEQTGLDETQVMEQLASMGSKENYYRKYIQKAIGEAEENFAGQYETTNIDALESVMDVRLKEMEEKIKEDVKKNNLTNIHKEAIKYLKELDIPANDKVKLLSKITQAKTRYSLKKVIDEMEQRGLGYKEAELKRKLKKEISKQLKYTKPVKSGSKTKGKYDYLSNKFFERLRGYDKLTIKKAEEKFAKFEEKINDPQYMPDKMDMLEFKFLSMKIMGLKKGSVEIMNQVLTGILDAKQVGRDVKDFDAFVKKMKTNNDIDKAKEILEKSKANADDVKTKAMNMYRKGFSNVWSLYNSIFGKEFADEFDFELAENRRNDAVTLKVKQVAQETARVFGLENESQINKKYQELGAEEYYLVDKTGDAVEYKLNKLQLMDIYNSMKNKMLKQRYEFYFGAEEVNSLLQVLTEQERSVADMWQEVAQEYYDSNNKRHIEIYGTDLGTVESYWMASSEYVQDVFDDMKVQGETPGFMKARAGMRIPVPKDAWQKISRHIYQSEHIQNMSRTHERMARMFNNRKVKELIQKKFGDDIYRQILEQIDNVSLNKQLQRHDAITNVAGKIINNWVTAKVALNPSVFAKQLISVGNYMENMDSGEWMKYFAEGMTNPKKTFEFMWEIAPFLEARYERGYSEAIQRAIREAGNVGKYNNNWTKALSSMVRMGDIGAIIYGGYPYIKSQIDAGVPVQEAVDNFERATLKAQQSGNTAGLSGFQNSRNPLSRLFLAFKNTPTQYLRKMVDANVMYFNGDIDSKQYAKTMAIFAVIQPLLYSLVGDAVRGILFGREPDEVMDNIMMNLALAPVNAVPVVEDMATYGLRVAMDKPVYKMFQTPVLDDIETAWKNFNKKEIEFYDVMESLGTFTELGSGLPADTYLRIIDSNFKRFSEGKFYIE